MTRVRTCGTLAPQVVVLHGGPAAPGQMAPVERGRADLFGVVEPSLQPHLPQIEYHEWEHCGHYPWLERAVQRDFVSVVRDWLARHLATNSAMADP